MDSLGYRFRRDPQVVDHSLRHGDASEMRNSGSGCGASRSCVATLDTYIAAWERSQTQIRKLIHSPRARVVIAIEEVWNKFLFRLPIRKYVDEFRVHGIELFRCRQLSSGFREWIRTIGLQSQVPLEDFRQITANSCRSGGNRLDRKFAAQPARSTFRFLDRRTPAGEKLSA